MNDFTSPVYFKLLATLKEAGYQLMPLIDLAENKYPRAVALRHDVDRFPRRAARMAEKELCQSITSTYFFRRKHILHHPDLIAYIASMGHEIGYHYENLAHCRGNADRAFREFTDTLRALRKITFAFGISMHGSPFSRHTNHHLWRKHSYTKLHIGYEAFLDFNYHQVAYITDTGRYWSDGSMSLRDSIPSAFTRVFLPKKKYTTDELCQLISKDQFPSLVILNIHPQRWNDKRIPWIMEWIGQSVKNRLKLLIRFLHKR
ncbi:MAG: hypothetical protein EOL88_03160 [Bacteroidia bacterium]|nr:hypothetical protein [Bacteroidia bacterium]HPE57651.1 hypothetical protein [Bacteroidales bacterium]